MPTYLYTERFFPMHSSTLEEIEKDIRKEERESEKWYRLHPRIPFCKEYRIKEN